MESSGFCRAMSQSLASLLLLAPLALGAAPSFWPRYGGAREVTLLDGEWQFGFNSDRSFDVLAPLDTKDPSLTPNRTSVPASVDAAPPGVLGRRGVALYRTHFLQNGHARLQFMGCSFYCRVFVDGQEVGEHRAGGYVPWWLDLPVPGTGNATRELFVMADNRFNRTTAPVHTGGDFWNYGGILRSVLLHDMPDDPKETWPWRAYVFPTAEDLGVVDIKIVMTSANFSGAVMIMLAFGTQEPSAANAVARAGETWIRSIQVPQPRTWSLKDPQMHTVTVGIGSATITERFGLRRWAYADGKLLLNGEAVKLHGWNHHTQWIDTGASPTDSQLDQDLALLREGHANFVRGAHYPQDQRWLDRLDESGMAMWEETLGPGVTVEDLQDWGHFMKYQLQQVDEMLAASMNHPSIMAWAWFNEGPSNELAACQAYLQCSLHAAEADPTRFRTWASNKKEDDKCLEHATAVSFNSYPAWYSEKQDLSAPKREWTASAAWAQRNFPDKPFFISETGAGGLYEWATNATDAYWTLKYQQEVIDADVDVALADSNVSGLTLWHFFDFKGNDEAQMCGPCQYLPGVQPPTCGWYNMSGHCENRPGGLNHKGVLDPYRRKKPSFSAVAQKYGQHTPAESGTGRVYIV